MPPIMTLKFCSYWRISVCNAVKNGIIEKSIDGVIKKFKIRIIMIKLRAEIDLADASVVWECYYKWYIDGQWAPH